MSQFITVEVPPSGETEDGDLRMERQDIQSILPTNQLNYTTIEYDSEMNVLNSDVRKDLRKIADLKSKGVFPSNLNIGNSYIKTSNGGKFIEFCPSNQGGSLFLKVRGAETIKETPQQVRIVSGPCLFSVNAAQVLHQDGSSTTLTMPGIEVEFAVSGFAIEDEITAYELESLERLTQTITQFASGIDLPITLSMNIPKVEYYLYIMSAVEKGFVTNAQALEWFNIVDNRSARLRERFSKNIQRFSNSRIQIENGNLLDNLEEYVKSITALGKLPAVDSMLEIITSQNALAELIVNCLEPKTYSDINYIGYIYEELRNAVVNGAVTIAIENPTEERIYVQASKIAKQLEKQGQDVNLCAIYPLGQVLNSHDKGLYFFNAKMPTRLAKAIIRQYRFNF